MKILTTVIAICSLGALFAQSHKAGTLSLQGDYEMGFMGTYSETESNGNVIAKDTSAAVLTSFGLGVHYSLAEFISAGVYGQYGSYIENEENVTSSGNQFLSFGAAVRAYPLNKDNFNWYVGGRVGLSSLAINRQVTIFIPIDFDYKYAAPEYMAETGINWYFLNFLGVNLNVNYQYRKLELKEYSINGTTQDMNNMSNFLKTSGLGFSAGVSLKIN